MTAQDRSILSIGHHGIVAGAYDSLCIADVIDTALPKTRHHHLSHSQVIKAMVVLNGLGFIEVSPYFPDFFDDIAVERLLGEGITSEHLNDDVLGRTLDAVAAYGPTELFNEAVAQPPDHPQFHLVITRQKHTFVPGYNPSK
ncbi:MAG: hypothetical protein PWP08_400 [Methanofollis sp.]|nr:hypothetical protein [Methanofollis sp.]